MTLSAGSWECNLLQKLRDLAISHGIEKIFHRIRWPIFANDVLTRIHTFSVPRNTMSRHSKNPSGHSKSMSGNSYARRSPAFPVPNHFVLRYLPPH